LEKDTQSRKYLLTINNPSEHGLDYEAVKLATSKLHTLYWCISTEIGKETETEHYHVYLHLKSPVRFSRIKKLFPVAHIDVAYGKAEANKAYVEKSGKWENDEKGDTKVPNTFLEFGTLPQEVGQGFRTDIASVYSKLADGASIAEIMEENPATAEYINKMEKIQQTILEERYRTTFRHLNVTYIWGATGTGKTRGVMEKHGYANVCRVTNFNHPFEGYLPSHSVLLFEEFRSSLPISAMLNYLDGYPLALPARYADRVACYTDVYIISNIPLQKQYPLVQVSEPETWKAFLRRIHSVIEYKEDGTIIEHGSALEYMYPALPVQEWMAEAEQLEPEIGLFEN